MSSADGCAKLVCYNPASLSRTFAAVKTVSDCIALQKQGEPALMTLARQSDEKQVKNMLFLNIAAFDKFLHLKNPLSETEADFIVEQLLDEFGGALTMADVHLVLRNAKAGKYGKFYERLSAPDILQWFRDYYSERLEAAYQNNLNADRRKHNGTGDNQVLARLGYKLDEDGRVQGYDAAQLERNDRERKEQDMIRQHKK